MCIILKVVGKDKINFIENNKLVKTGLEIADVLKILTGKKHC